MNANPNTLKVITVDDEFLARENLKLLVSEFCEGIEVVGEASNVNEALQVISEQQPDLVFLDIRMPSGAEGFELLDKIPNKNFQVIFVTAFKDYAIKAFKANAIHYILKPIDIEELIAAVNKVKELHQKHQEEPNTYRDYMSRLINLSKELSQKSTQRITISHTKGIKIVDDDSIVRLEADGNCTNIYFADHSSYLDTRTLKVYEDLLNPQRFKRIHKSHIINTDYLSEYSSEEGNFALMKSGEKIPVSRSKLADFISFVKSIG